MKLIFALGNPGARYALTRHNSGFLLVDHLAAEQAVGFAPKPKLLADIAQLTTSCLTPNTTAEKVILAKPTTFYNEAGRAARAIMSFYRLSLDDILVIHDDIAISLGTVRVRRGGSDGGNNGLKSLHSHIGSDFWHIRIGTQTAQSHQVPADKFVLMTLPADERALITDRVAPVVQSIVSQFIGHQITPHTTKV